MENKLATSSSLLQQLPEEDNKWFDRFHKFVMLGAPRSISAVYCAEYKQNAGAEVPKVWVETAEKFDWQNRAKAYDEYLRDIDRLTTEQERLKIRERRRKVISKGLEAIEQLFERMEMDEEEGGIDLFRGAKLGEINHFFKAVLENARLEFGDDPMSLQKEKEAAKENTASEGVVVKVEYSDEIGGL